MLSIFNFIGLTRMCLVQLTYSLSLDRSYQDSLHFSEHKTLHIDSPLCKIDYFHQVPVKLNASVRPYFLLECIAIH